MPGGGKYVKQQKKANIIFFIVFGLIRDDGAKNRVQ
jgi:hypothetical protein